MDRPGHQEESREEAHASPPGVRRRSLLPLVLCLGVLLLGFTMEASPERATWRGIEGPRCPSKWLPEDWKLHEAGCPGCGLTRATSMAVQGEVKSSFRVHPAGVLVAVLAALGALIHGGAVVTNYRPPGMDWVLVASRWLLLLGLAVGWTARLI